jgi:hypothetical protein
MMLSKNYSGCDRSLWTSCHSDATVHFSYSLACYASAPVANLVARPDVKAAFGSPA